MAHTDGLDSQLGGAIDPKLGMQTYLDRISSSACDIPYRQQPVVAV